MSFSEIATCGLVFYPDSEPGITRRRAGRGFSYRAPDGTRVNDAVERARIEAIAVPPAYNSVWISPMLQGHLQATGLDDRARKQYRYHADWTQHHTQLKFDKLVGFAESLPSLRRWIERRLRGEIGERETAVAAILALIDRASLRVGHSSYTEENGSYGATTILSRHAVFSDGHVQLAYTGKGGAEVEKDIYAPRLCAVLESCRDLPGAEIVTWLDDEGEPHPVRSEHINAKLHAICGDDVTAKSVRTWNGTLAAFRAINKTQDITIKDMAEAAADALHNTPTVARNSYIHPAVIALTQMPEKDRDKALQRSAGANQVGLRQHEAQLLSFLRNN